MHSRIVLLLLAASLLFGLAGCGRAAGPVPKAPVAGLRTRTPRPTFTPTPTSTQPAPTATPAPTGTPVPPTEVPTPTNPPPKPMLTVNALANVREGPGATYPRLAQLQAGQQIEIIGRNADADWWQFDLNGQPAWIAGSMVTVNEVAGDAPVVEVARPPAPVVQAPPPQAKPQPQPQAQPPAQPTPAPQTRFAAAGSEARDAADTKFDQVTFWGRLGSTSSSGPISDAPNYKLRVVSSRGSAEKAFNGVWEVAYSGLPQNQFLYNVKIELPRSIGSWTAVIVDGSGTKVSDEQSGTLIDKSHDVILTWMPR